MPVVLFCIHLIGFFFCRLPDADGAPCARIPDTRSDLIGERSDADVVGASHAAARSFTVDDVPLVDGGSDASVRRRTTSMRDRQSVVSIPAWLGRQNTHAYARRRRRHVTRHPSAQLLQQQRGRKQDELDETDDSENSLPSPVVFSRCSLPASLAGSKLEFTGDSVAESTVANRRGTETHHVAVALHRQNVRQFTAIVRDYEFQRSLRWAIYVEQ